MVVYGLGETHQEIAHVREQVLLLNVLGEFEDL